MAKLKGKEAGSLSRNTELEAIYFGRLPPPHPRALSSRSSLMRLLDNDPCMLVLIRPTHPTSLPVL